MDKENFIQEFKQLIVNGVYYNMPKDYRKGLEYSEMSFDEKYRQALSHSSIERVLNIVAEHYYEIINDLEETLGY